MHLVTTMHRVRCAEVGALDSCLFTRQRFADCFDAHPRQVVMHAYTVSPENAVCAKGICTSGIASGYDIFVSDTCLPTRENRRVSLLSSFRPFFVHPSFSCFPPISSSLCSLLSPSRAHDARRIMPMIDADVHVGTHLHTNANAQSHSQQFGLAAQDIDVWVVHRGLTLTNGMVPNDLNTTLKPIVLKVRPKTKPTLP